MLVRPLMYCFICYVLMLPTLSSADEDPFLIQVKARHAYFPKLVCTLADFNIAEKAPEVLAPQVLAAAKLAGECGLKLDVENATDILKTQDDLDSLTLLGESYLVYLGKTAEGLQLLKKAALQGSKVALKDLDLLYSGGGSKYGITLDIAEALKWKSLRFSISQDKRATLYENGSPDKLDLTERELGRAEGFAQALAKSDPELLPKIAQEAKALELDILKARDGLFTPSASSTQP